MRLPLVVLPPIQKPNALSQDMFVKIRGSFLKWSKETMIREGGIEAFEMFVALSETIAKLKTLDSKMLLFTLTSQPARDRLFGAIQTLKQAYPDSLVINEALAELLCLFAEAGDLYLREQQTLGFKLGSNLKTNEVARKLLGCATIEEIEITYHSAFLLFGKCCLLYAHFGNTVPVCMYGVLYDQWFSSYLRALTRTFLVKMADRVLTIDPAAEIPISGAYYVLPHLVSHPEIREAIDPDSLEHVYTDLVKFFFMQEVNTTESGYGIFNNLAILAIILGDIQYARESIRLARTFSQGRSIPNIGRMEQLIETLHPCVHA